MFDRIVQMFIKELIHVLRDRRMRGVIFIAPVIQLIVLSYAVTTDVKNIRMAVCDFDATPQSREIVSRFAGSTYFHIVAQVAREYDAQQLMDREDIQCFVTIQTGFAREILAGRTAPLQLVVDGTDSSSARLIIDYAAEITEQYGAQLLADRYLRRTGDTIEPDRVDLRTRAWYNVNLESRNYYVPGMLALIIGLVTLMLTSMSVVREVEIGTMEQLMVTPIRRFELILGKTVPFACISLVEMTVVLCVAMFWFRIPFAGNLPEFVLCAILYIVCMLGVGLFISSSCRTQRQAMMTNILFLMPSILLSDFLFPIVNMPTVVQWLTLANPMRYFIAIVRGMFLKGIGPEILWPNMVMLAVLGVLVLSLAAGRLKKTMA